MRQVVFRVEWIDFKGREHRTKVEAYNEEEAKEWIKENRVTCARILTAYKSKEDKHERIIGKHFRGQKNWKL